MLVDIIVMRAWRGDRLDLDRHAWFSSAVARLRQGFRALFAGRS